VIYCSLGRALCPDRLTATPAAFAGEETGTPGLDKRVATTRPTASSRAAWVAATIGGKKRAGRLGVIQVANPESGVGT
jgi:hypothetical protein